MKKVDVGEGWRRVKDGEKRQEGDEWWSVLRSQWIRCVGYFGDQHRSCDCPLRRRVEAPASTAKPLTRVTVKKVTGEWTKEMGFERHSREGAVPLTVRDMMEAEVTYNTMRKGLKAGDVLMVEFS